MRIIVGLLLAGALLGQTDWRTAAELPGVDWRGVSPQQKQLALKVLREAECGCGCPMKLAQCRVEDPACTQSRALAALLVEAAAAGQNEAQLRKTLEDSPYMKQARDRNRILLDPVAIPVIGAPVKGAAGARITLVEFSDFQCPYCLKATAQLDAILKAFPNDVRLIYKQFPLDTHSQARLAAEASLAAHQQGKFWPLHDRMYADSRRINRANILAWAAELGLDMSRFARDLDAQRIRAAVDQDLADGERSGVEGTPTVFLNGKKYMGSLDPRAFAAVILAELGQK